MAACVDVCLRCTYEACFSCLSCCTWPLTALWQPSPAALLHSCVAGWDEPHVAPVLFSSLLPAQEAASCPPAIKSGDNLSLTGRGPFVHDEYAFAALQLRAPGSALVLVMSQYGIVNA